MKNNKNVNDSLGKYEKKAMVTEEKKRKCWKSKGRRKKIASSGVEKSILYLQFS